MLIFLINLCKISVLLIVWVHVVFGWNMNRLVKPPHWIFLNLYFIMQQLTFWLLNMSTHLEWCWFICRWLNNPAHPVHHPLELSKCESRLRYTSRRVSHQVSLSFAVRTPLPNMLSSVSNGLSCSNERVYWLLLLLTVASFWVASLFMKAVEDISTRAFEKRLNCQTNTRSESTLFKIALHGYTG